MLKFLIRNTELLIKKQRKGVVMSGARPRYEEDQEYNKFNSQLATRLRTARLAAGFTQDQLVDLIGVSKSVLSKSENSKDPQKTSAYLVRRYAEICGQDISYFFEDMPRARKKVKDEKIEGIRKQLTWLNENELDVVYSLIAQYIKIRKK